MTVIEPTDWEARLSEATSGYIRRQAARRAEHEEFKRRRDYGLIQRHARKAAHNRRQEQQS